MEQTLGKRIAENRKRMKLTQDQLAEKLGVTAQAVSKWENEQSCPDIMMLPRLAEIFGMSTDALLGREATIPTFQGEVVEENEPEGIHVSKGGWEFHWDGGKREALTTAFLVLLVGGLMLAGRLLSWNVSFWGILWPSALLVYGLRFLRKFSVFSFGVALFGGYSLVHNLGIWSLNIANELIFPIVILLFGLGLFIDALKKPRKPEVTFHRKGNQNRESNASFTEDNEHFDCSVNFSGQAYSVTLPRVSSGSANVSFGELVVDLTKCAEIANGCNLALACSFGDLELLLPKSCRVVMGISNSFGAADISGQPDPDAAIMVNVDGSVSFGNIDIRYV